MRKNAYIGQLSGGKWRVYSEKGKNLGTYDSYEAAEKRLKDVEMFKHMDKKKKKRKRRKVALDILNSTPTTNYSETMRWLNKNAPESVESFMKTFKIAFDEAVEKDLEDPANAAMLQALQTKASKTDERIFKLAQNIIHMGSPEIAGKGLADIVSFIMKRVPGAQRSKAIASLRQKILDLNEKNIAVKKVPETASFGQAITFIKTVLNGHDPAYIRKVLTSISANLQY